mmetsp:Transcript_11958/g.33663  ORF Transcript_11958/g.33663 Transcript_11958/m.33663 type:complete len:437 (+) Transcript_11958:30-1340(+)
MACIQHGQWLEVEEHRWRRQELPGTAEAPCRGRELWGLACGGRFRGSAVPSGAEVAVAQGLCCADAPPEIAISIADHLCREVKSCAITAVEEGEVHPSGPLAALPPGVQVVVKPLKLVLNQLLLHRPAKVGHRHLQEHYAEAEGVKEVWADGLPGHGGPQCGQDGRRRLGEVYGCDEVLRRGVAVVQHPGRRVEVDAGGEVDGGTKVDDQDFALNGDNEVLGLDIPVNNANLVQATESLQHLLHEVLNHHRIQILRLIAFDIATDKQVGDRPRELPQGAVQSILQGRVALKLPHHPLGAAHKASAICRVCDMLSHVPRAHWADQWEAHALAAHVGLHDAGFHGSAGQGAGLEQVSPDVVAAVPHHLLHDHPLVLLLWGELPSHDLLLVKDRLVRDPKVPSTKLVTQREDAVEFTCQGFVKGSGDVEVDDVDKRVGA